MDEWLLETSTTPLLRVYAWDGDWGSLGYFGRISAARSAFPGLSWVRRWTGGGIVDHRADWTYTVIAPPGSRLAALRGAESYRTIHAALADALADEGIRARLSDGNAATGAPSCFENPVGHDLVAGDGAKIAGAGQRRGRHGLLHQGSLAVACPAGISALRAAHLASSLSEEWANCELAPPADLIARKSMDRYANDAWTGRC